MNDRRSRMALTLVCEPGDPRLAAALTEMTATDVLTRIRAGRRILGQPCPAAWQYGASDVDERLGTTEAMAQAAGLRWLTPADGDWPEHLNDLNHVDDGQGSSGAPLGLWVRGDRSLRTVVETSVAIVGARDCTGYGAQVAADIAADVSSAGITVVSGAAYGIDASAHRGALSTLSPTVAVLACDAATDYPRAHGPMLARIAEEGLVVSEQPPGQVPTKSRFLSRNRIIAALTRGTVVVEARRRSGSLNTLGWADRLGRVTMAVPGPVTSPQSVGPHVAVREGRAILVASGADVADELAALGVASPGLDVEADATAWDSLAPESARVLDALDWKTPLDVDEVARRARVSRGAAERALGRLTRAGWVAAAGPTLWLLVRRADLAPPGATRTVEE